ncbi:MAG: hypothetical protein RJA76_496 [Bacteroidota bacterium]|jgi:hypothetical protein
MNKVVSIALGAGLVYGIVRLLRMQNVSEVANARLVNPRIHSVTLGGISFRTEVEINNPSRDSVKLTKPVVTLTSKGKMLTQSDAEDQIITIKPLGLTKIDTIELELDWFTLKGLVANIIKNVPKVIAAWKAGDKKNLITLLGVPLEMNFTTYVNGIFYQSPSEKLI